MSGYIPRAERCTQELPKESMATVARIWADTWKEQHHMSTWQNMIAEACASQHRIAHVAKAWERRERERVRFTRSMTRLCWLLFATGTLYAAQTLAQALT